MTTQVGRLCFRYRWWVLLGWLLLLVGGVVAAGRVLEGLGTTQQSNGPESVQAREVLDANNDRGGEVIAVLDGVDPRSVAAQAAVARAAADVRRIDGVAEVHEPVVASDDNGVALAVTLSKLDGDATDDAVRQVSERLRRMAGEVPGATVRLGGGEVLGQQVNDAVQADLGNAELRSLPATAIVLVFVFGGLIAAGVPLLGTLATMAGAFAVLLGFSRVVELDGNVVTVVSLLGLGLSIDYGLLLVARYREELVAEYRQQSDGRRRVDRAGRSAALARTWGTAGRTIMFSALIVAAALCGLLPLQVTSLQTMAAAGISVALVAMVAALTLTAALLGVFGRRIRPSRRGLRSAAATARGDDGAARDGTAGGFFGRLARFTQRWPVLVTLGVTAALIAAAAPLLTATIKLPHLEGMPRSIESVAVADDLSARYGRTTEPALIVVARTDPGRLDAWAARWRVDTEVTRVEPARAAGPNLATVVLAVRGGAQGDGARALVQRVRADRPPGVESWVTGDAAVLDDMLATLRAGLPWAFAVTLLAMTVLLFLMTRSLVVPVKAIAMAVGSLGATFGAMVALFQYGWLSGLLDTQPTGGLSPFVLGIVFAFAFGLSMDYEVFLLGRIKEHVDAGYTSDAAVRHGLQHTGRIITSAALLMLIVFGFFGAAKVGDIEQIGIGLFIAVLVDATLVRCLLVPATMSLLGRWNWWAPRPWRRAHDQVARTSSGVDRTPPPAVSVSDDGHPGPRLSPTPS